MNLNLNKTDLKILEVAELNQNILLLKKKLFFLRLKKARSEPIKNHEFKVLKHQISQLLFFKSLKS